MPGVSLLWTGDAGVPGQGYGARMEQTRSGEGLPDRVEIRRSARRRRSVSARVEPDKVVVLMPAGLTPTQEQEHVEELVARLRRRRRRTRLAADDLAGRAATLSRTYLEDRAHPSSVRWVTNQGRRWGSCSVHERTIRISGQLEGMPPWVVDAVLVHELAHLLVAHHGPEFTAWVQRYPRYTEAQGFLAGVSWAQAAAGSSDPTDPLDPPAC